LRRPGLVFGLFVVSGIKGSTLPPRNPRASSQTKSSDERPLRGSPYTTHSACARHRRFVQLFVSSVSFRSSLCSSLICGGCDGFMGDSMGVIGLCGPSSTFAVLGGRVLGVGVWRSRSRLVEAPAGDAATAGTRIVSGSLRSDSMSARAEAAQGATVPSRFRSRDVA